MANSFTSLTDALAEHLALLERHPTPANLVLRGLLGALLHVLVEYLRAPRRGIAPGLSPRRPLRDWHPFPSEQDAQSPAQLRRWRRLRAFVGWILRACPNRGISDERRSRVPARPTRTARAPPGRILPPAPWQSKPQRAHAGPNATPESPPHPPESRDSDGANLCPLANPPRAPHLPGTTPPDLAP